MPAFAGPLVGLSLGALLARWGKGPPGVRGALPLLVLGALVFGPACAYPLLFFPDWAHAYLFDSRSLPSAVVLALVLVDVAAPAAGYVLARRALAREALGENAQARATALAYVAVPAGVAALLGVALAPRLASVGNYAMVRGDFGVEPLWRSPLGYALVWMTACIGAGVWLTGRTLVTWGAGGRGASAPNVPEGRSPAEGRPAGGGPAPSPHAGAEPAPRPYLGTRRRG